MSYDCDFGVLWILSNSRSALQHLSGWSSANDETSISILLKLRKISQISGCPPPMDTKYHMLTLELMRLLIDWPKRVERMKRLLAHFAHLLRTAL
ncbi:hypothetical protein TNIN_390301 [Trichonephila inaurata madagascariensis]|uniref:Uncharacterized protein n=1 Tax=Trichonephila inaurata madagascariensis TaxID=2747483 RepID=A0A8X6XRF0_9ARAC|nr:hypothetical protein TNIN_390301 [Trichonephila inaurata madagascariensis]